ncbi:MAG: hypothetical protein RLY58_1130 [Pseudomonadota bacterium]|jgi:pyridoxal phosphate enzyme (YggS family)
MTDLSQQRQQILSRMQQASQAVARAVNSVTLLAVSKYQSVDAIRQVYADGQRAFGENYVQEALLKQQALADLAIEWHFIGQVQRNKTRDLAAGFAWVHGVDREVIAERLSAQRPLDQPPLNLCLQVNVDDEETKGGCHPSALPQLVAQISQLPQIRLRGLMVIPARDSTPAFAQTQQWFEALRCHHACPDDWDTLSMGMSADLESAIAHGATLVRVGTALFGERVRAS